MNVFVSGGAGVIGRELVSRLVAQGHTILVADLKDRPEEFPASVKYMQGDLNEFSRLGTWDVLFHLAATFERLGESPDHWEQNYKHNVNLSHHLFSNITATRIVFASSYLVEPYPRNLTGAAKLYTECELEFLREHKGQDSVSARIYRSYGCGSRDVISRWVRAAIKGETLTVHNDETSLDFIYAGDVAEALIRLADSTSGVCHVGTGRPRTIRDVVDVIQMHFPKLNVAWVGSHAAIETSMCDVSRMQEDLDWTPPTTLEEGIKRIIEYEKAQCG